MSESRHGQPNRVMHEDDPVIMPPPTRITRIRVNRLFLLAGAITVALLIWQQIILINAQENISEAARDAKAAVTQVNKERADRSKYVNKQLQNLGCLALMNIPPDQQLAKQLRMQELYKDCPAYIPPKSPRAASGGSAVPSISPSGTTVKPSGSVTAPSSSTGTSKPHGAVNVPRVVPSTSQSRSAPARPVPSSTVAPAKQRSTSLVCGTVGLCIPGLTG